MGTWYSSIVLNTIKMMITSIHWQLYIYLFSFLVWRWILGHVLDPWSEKVHEHSEKVGQEKASEDCEASKGIKHNMTIYCFVSYDINNITSWFPSRLIKIYIKYEHIKYVYISYVGVSLPFSCEPFFFIINYVQIMWHVSKIGERKLHKSGRCLPVHE